VPLAAITNRLHAQSGFSYYGDVVREKRPDSWYPDVGLALANFWWMVRFFFIKHNVFSLYSNY
jgi:hypothetical protein